jgi:ABC-type multidrug transport system fused ATPase/permease subunit
MVRARARCDGDSRESRGLRRERLLKESTSVHRNCRISRLGSWSRSSRGSDCRLADLAYRVQFEPRIMSAIATISCTPASGGEPEVACSPQEVRRLLLRRARPYAGRLAIGAFFVLADTSLGLALPLLFAALVDAAVGTVGAPALGRAAGAVGAIVVAQAALSGVHTTILRGFADRLALDLRAAFYRHLLRLPLGFHHRARSGELLSAATSDIDKLQAVAATFVGQAVGAPVMLVCALALMVHESPKLTCLMAVAVPVIVVAVLTLGAGISRHAEAAQAATAEANGTLQEGIAAIETVQAFRGEKGQGERFEAALRDSLRLESRRLRAETLFKASINMAALGALVCTLWLGGRLVAQHELTGGRLVALLIYAVFAQGCVGALTQTWSGAQSAIGALRRVFGLMSLPVDECVASTPRSRGRGELSFEGVSFRYSTDAPAVLSDISFCVEAGTVCGIVGASGSGKTTLIRLLYRFYDPTAGRITLDGVDVREVSRGTHRAALALVSQDPVLFTGTIRDNIRFARPDASDAEVEAAARAAHCEEFVSASPEGYDTLVGERGVTLSGGQRQRVALARAILADSEVLILDEPTSALDSESERQVRAAILGQRGVRTTLVISHRAAALRDADDIIRLEGGRIVDCSRTLELAASAE